MLANFRNWFFLTLAISLVVCLIHLGLVYSFYQSSRYDIIWINSVLSKKDIFADNVKENKIIFAGGSSTLFGIRTSDIQKALGIPSVNFGIHAGVDLDYLLFRTKKLLKPGDTVVLTVEYPLFLYDGKFKNITLDYMLTYDRNFFNSLSFWNEIRYLADISPIQLVVSFAKHLMAKPQASEAGVGYNSADENGDATGNIGHHEEAIGLRFSKPFEIQRGNFRETPGLKLIRDFQQWCLDHNVHFYVTYASTMYFKEYDTPQYRRYFSELQKYFAQHNVPTIGAPQDFFFPRDFFYDTAYHLNQKGMTIRTTQLIDKINNLGIAARMRNPLIGEGGEKAVGRAPSPFRYH
jgi:hypothetical protein